MELLNVYYADIDGHKIRYTKEELDKQLEYSKRQFEVFKMKALLSQTRSQCAKFNAPHYVSSMSNWIEEMSKCNDFIDALNRAVPTLER